MHAYTAHDEVREDGTQKSQRVFVNLPTQVGATEAEEIGGWGQGVPLCWHAGEPPGDGVAACGVHESEHQRRAGGR